MKIKCLCGKEIVFSEEMKKKLNEWEEEPKKIMEIKPFVGEEEGFKMVYLGNGNQSKKFTPHCKKHEAMNKITDNIWRCLSEYKYVTQPNETMAKFIERSCNAVCVEVKE